ncbi:MAG: ABC transporter permease [candidate division Zixibacteria bacterium]|nr:ABC transporter permease [candidate division Zixibacteria bacterium]MDH3936848.1 ABC transporter permease [candidate division Zixibacteria bacterium]MDH4033141.1 ABC transporter permease [candidate division Zixibacteria bacterium]
MRLYLKLAWRNIFRNKRRTFIAGTAIGIGLASLILVDAISLGMEENMLHSATASFMGEGQIHGEGFRSSFEMESCVIDAASVMTNLSEEPIVARFTPRLLSYAMISSPANVTGVSMVGIDPNTEPGLSQIDEAVVEGTYLTPDGRRELVIGDKLAELMEVSLGDRVVLTTSQAHGGDLAQEMFRVTGIFHFNIDAMDRAMVFTRLNVAQRMLNLEGDIHEIALKFVDGSGGADLDSFWEKYSKNGNEAVGWATLLPQLKMVFEFSDFSILLVGIILFSVVALGIVNTLFMSLYERMFEFGVMRAVGTRPFVMGRLVVFEAGALAAVSCLLGTILGWVVTYAFAQTGIDYTGIEYAGVTFRELLYPVIQLEQYIQYPIAVFIFTIIIGIYPAWYAARMNAARAMRRSF